MHASIWEYLGWINKKSYPTTAGKCILNKCTQEKKIIEFDNIVASIYS